MLEIAAAEIAGASMAKLEDVSARAASIRIILAKLRHDPALESVAKHIELRALGKWRGGGRGQCCESAWAVPPSFFGH